MSSFNSYLDTANPFCNANPGIRPTVSPDDNDGDSEHPGPLIFFLHSD